MERIPCSEIRRIKIVNSTPLDFGVVVLFVVEVMVVMVMALVMTVLVMMISFILNVTRGGDDAVIAVVIRGAAIVY